MTNENEQLRRSWVANAASWRDAVRERKIESRRIATDAAIVDVVAGQAPERVVDLGCGEGWLVRELSSRGIETVGVDASRPLIDAAREMGGSFYALSYEELAAGELPMGDAYDVAVANFSILAEDLGPILAAAARLLGPEGALVIQTIHPAFATGDLAYVPGWRTETFSAIEGAWPEPMPWYFRTISAWVRDLSKHGFTITEMTEPLDAEQAKPLSMIFVCRKT